jgi:formylglycine-generating enzyme required for sulfatase activity
VLLYTLERAAAAVLVDVPLIAQLSPLAWALLSAVALVLWVAGTRLRQLPEVARAEEVRVRDQDEQHSRDQRAELETHRLLTGTPEVELWQVPVHPPVAPAAMGAAASVLLRLRADEGRPELDLPRTLRDTLDAGGRFSPALTPRALPSRVLVWVEVPPEGEHAWSRRLDRLLDGLGTLGVELERWEYAGQPDRLRSPTGPRLDAVDVGRRTAGWPVLVLGRGLDPWSRDGRRERPWVRARRACGPVAWVDPDPAGQADPQLERLGVRRFPFTEAGVEAAARWLVGDGRAAPSEDPEALNLPEAALWRWALAAAMVPEATWDQLEAVRRAFPDLERELPGPWAVRGLLDWVARQPEMDGPDGGRSTLDAGGPRLLLPRALEDRLLRQYRERAPGEPALQVFVDRVNRLLLDQLGADPPGEGLARALWALRTGWIRARVEPARAVELLARVLEGPLAPEAKALIAAELDRQSGHPVLGADWTEVDQRVLTLIVDPPSGVPLASVWRGARSAWPRPVRVLAVAVALAVLGLGAWWGLPAAGRLGLAPRAEAVLPESFVLRAETGELRPTMVRIEVGSFTMGSPVTEEGRDDNEGPVAVRFSRPFELATTEVTQAQYRRVMGEEPWGDTLRGDDLPAHTVSWDEAVRYCNRLSEKEGLTPAYDLSTSPPTWDPAANGYRLPAQAEWEYAARAGTTTRYVGTDDSSEVCARDNVGSMFSCEDGVAELSAVGRFAANGWGLYDMGGNLFEWTWDTYDPTLGGGSDPASLTGVDRVIRGGSWRSGTRGARVSSRWYRSPSYRYVYLGFRPARYLAP